MSELALIALSCSNLEASYGSLVRILNSDTNQIPVDLWADLPPATSTDWAFLQCWPVQVGDTVVNGEPLVAPLCARVTGAEIIYVPCGANGPPPPPIKKELLPEHGVATLVLQSANITSYGPLTWADGTTIFVLPWPGGNAPVQVDALQSGLVTALAPYIPTNAELHCYNVIDPRSGTPPHPLDGTTIVIPVDALFLPPIRRHVPPPIRRLSRRK